MIPLPQADAIDMQAQRISLPVDALVPGLPSSPDHVQFIVSGDWTELLGEQSDGTIRNVGGSTASVYLLTLAPAAAP
jgi:hypothetical protein